MLYLVRHGKASPSEAVYDRLHERGVEQARLLGAHFAARSTRFDAVYCGPLVRQRDTWRHVCDAASHAARGWPEAHILDGLREAPVETIMRECMVERIDQDVVLRQTLERVQAAGEDRDALRAGMTAVLDHMMALWREDALAKEGLESYAAFRSRVLDSFDTIATACPGESEVAVVTSNGVIGCIVEHLDGRSAGDAHSEILYANSSITSLEPAGHRWRVVARNVHEHLSDPKLVTYL